LDLRGTMLQEAREDYIMRNFVTCTLHQILLEIKEEDLGRACSMNGREEKSVQYFRWKT